MNPDFTTPPLLIVIVLVIVISPRASRYVDYEHEYDYDYDLPGAPTRSYPWKTIMYGKL